MLTPLIRSRVSALLIGTVVVTLALAACSSPAPETSDAPGPRPAGPVDPADPDLRSFYDQEISFGACAPFATNDAEERQFASDGLECGWLEVSLDYEDPTGTTAQIAVLRSRAPGGAVGSLVVNPGGPGGTGTSFAATLARTTATSPVGRTFDIVGFDPRGTGASTPALDCFDDDEREEDAVVIPFIAGGEQYTKQGTRRLAERCAERSGGEEVLVNSGTRNVARDMDVLREVLGDQQLTFLGDSWGTRLGAVYAEMYPQNVRAMVLDGALDPTARWSERALTQFASFQKSFEAVARTCAEDPECPLGTDPGRATERLQQLLEPLAEDPLPAVTLTAAGPSDEERSLTQRAALDGVLAGLYGEIYWPAIITGLKEVQAGRGDTLLALRDGFHQRSADGSYNNLLENTTALYCADEERLSPREATRMREKILQAAPFMDLGQERRTRDGCEHWPVEPNLGFPYAEDVPDLPAALVVSVTGDPATPYQDGVALAETLGAGLLSVDGNKHGVVLIEGNRCIDDVVADYLIDLEQPAEGARCDL